LLLAVVLFPGRIPTEFGLLTNLSGNLFDAGLNLAANQLTGV
jgi:hypothetical protein